VIASAAAAAPRAGTLDASDLHMQLISSRAFAPLALFTSLLAGCVTSGTTDDDSTADPAEPEVGEVQAADIVVGDPVPLCPDKHAKLILPPQACVTHGEPGTRICTDHITFHYGLKLKPPPGGFECVLVDTDVTTTCGPCIALGFPQP
jgi:hypothetical protein